MASIGMGMEMPSIGMGMEMASIGMGMEMKDMAHLCLQGLIKVLVFLDERFHSIEGGAYILTCQERLPLCHPALCLLSLTIEQL